MIEAKRAAQTAASGRARTAAALGVVAVIVAAGCADILGLEPPGGSGDTASTNGTSGTAGNASGAAGTASGAAGNASGAAGSGGASAGAGGTASGAAGSIAGAAGSSDPCMDPNCPGDIQQVEVFTSGGVNDIRAAVYDDAGNLFIAGGCQNCGPSIDVLGCKLDTQMGVTGVGFVARLDSGLNCTWASRVESEGTTRLSRLATDGKRLWAIGSVSGAGSFWYDHGGASGALSPSQGTDAVALELDPTVGAVMDSFVIGGMAQDTGADVEIVGTETYLAVEVSGDGSVRRSMMGAESYPIAPGAGGFDILLIRLDPDNKVAAMRPIGNKSDDRPSALSLAGSRLIMGGNVNSTLMVDSCEKPAVDKGASAFLVSLETASLSHSTGLCSLFGAPGPIITDPVSYTRSITGYPGGAFAAAGSVVGPADMAMCGLPYNGTTPQAWLWLGSAASPCLQTLHIEGPTYSEAVRAEDVDNNVYFLGHYRGMLGGQPSQSLDIFFQHYATNKLDAPDWEVEFGAGGDDESWDFTRDPKSNSVVLVGGCRDGMFLGHACDKSEDGFIVRLSL